MPLTATGAQARAAPAGCQGGRQDGRLVVASLAAHAAALAMFLASPAPTPAPEVGLAAVAVEIVSPAEAATATGAREASAAEAFADASASVAAVPAPAAEASASVAALPPDLLSDPLSGPLSGFPPPPRKPAPAAAALPSAGQGATGDAAGETAPESSDLAPVAVAPAAAVAAAAPHPGNPPPRYPYLARVNGSEGRVVLTVEVLPAGVCGAVVVTSSSGHALLDAAAVEAVRGWRFRPATLAGNPVASSIVVPIRFRLDGRAAVGGESENIRGRAGPG